MANESSGVRKLFQILISLAIQRCRLSGILCRLTISLKCFRELETPCVRISISDTGVGSCLDEFRTMDFGAHLVQWDKWDGLLFITTTSINEKDIHHYRLNLQEAVSSKVRLKRLPSTSKHFGTFSGTEVYFSTDEDNIDELVTWVVHFVQKMLVLKVQDILVDLSIQNIDNQSSRHEHFLLKTEDPFSASGPLFASSVESMTSGLEDYILKHRGSEEIACSVRGEDMKVGMGHASRLRTARNAGQVFDVAIVIVPATTVPCCSRASSQTTEVLYYQNFSPTSISKFALSSLEGIKWQAYGLKLKEIVVDGDGQAVLQWEDLPLAHIDIAIHSFFMNCPSPEDHLNGTVLPTSQETTDMKLLRKAVKTALDDLKNKYTELFLSSHSRKIQKHAPDLSRSIASLIASSNDQEFQAECASLLGLNSKDSDTKMLQICIQEKLMKIISMNDLKKGKGAGAADLAPNLFECEPLDLHPRKAHENYKYE
ncbi:type 2 DNA topoisomerase 6 subunit B-like [Phalaenopsis equestris]|uniref:type 2 DNA topoisomerase 6 subunit B-like n=1 Tax=Phalaenopsis equestris TaxID=78828 RepID=UPI0009E4D70E|nr:type 2 DNA topoisomerase 6 subunit B-like [Phalaenopsis equestris]